MNEATAQRLVGRAGRRRPDGSHSMLARRALKRLLRAGDAGDGAATEGLWRAWLAGPQEEMWAALERWGRPAVLARAHARSLVALGRGSVQDPALRAALISAAVLTAHPLGETARARIAAHARDLDLADAVCEAVLAADADAADALADLCRGHGIAPADPVRRAVFFLLTGQDEQHRAADPDGSLLALGYGAATEPERERLRQAMTRAGDLDLVRVVAARRDDRPDLTSEEWEYLIRQLADRADWQRLWPVVRDAPLIDAVAAMRSFDQRWRPAGDRDRGVFGQLLRASAGPLAAARDALIAMAVIQIDVRDPVVDAALSNDGKRLAVITASPEGEKRIAETRWAGMFPADTLLTGEICVFDLASQGLTATHPFTGRMDHAQIIAVGDAFVATQFYPRRSDVPGTRYARGELLRCADGRCDLLPAFPGQPRYWPFRALAPRWPRAGGFAALIDRYLYISRDDGKAVSRHDVLTALDLTGYESFSPIVLASDGGSPRLAVAGAGRLGLLDRQRGTRYRMLAAAHAAGRAEAQRLHCPEVLLCGGDRLITTNTLGVQAWRLAGSWLEMEDAAQVAGARNPVLLPIRREIAVLDGQQTVRYLDAETLQPVAEQREFTGLPGTCLRASASGKGYVLAGEGIVRAVPHLGIGAALQLADRPAGQWVPADIALAARLLGDPSAAPARPLLELMRDRLTIHFGAEVALGEAAYVAASADDIALRAAGEDTC